MQACLLIYDIPDTADIPNPSNRLRRIAVRVNLSCWVVREGDIPYNYLHWLKEQGATWHVVKFDTDENEKLVKMALDSIRKDIRLSIQRAKASADSAGCKLNDPDMTPEDKSKRYDSVTRATIKRLKETLNSLSAAAKLFGITDRDISLNEALQQTTAIQSSVARKAAEYNRAINRLASLYGDNDGMVRNARGDRVPAGILADNLEERGNGREDASLAQKLRGMFE
jgi:hypothetical protein